MANSAAQAGRSETARKVVLIGWAAKGVVYLTLSYLVLQVALGSATQEASTSGAVRTVAATAPGQVATIALGVGLLFFAVGRILEVTTLAEPQIGAGDRVKAAVLAALYASLALTAFNIVRQSASTGGGSTEQQSSGFLLGLPGGRFIVGVVGLAVIGYGAYEAYKGVKQRFLGTLRTGQMSPAVRSGITRLGIAAYVTKGFIVALVGYFFLRSAITYNPDEARGLDAALGEIAQESGGQAVLVAVAVGLLAYAAFAFVESRYRRVGSSATGMT